MFVPDTNHQYLRRKKKQSRHIGRVGFGSQVPVWGKEKKGTKLINEGKKEY